MKLMLQKSTSRTKRSKHHQSKDSRTSGKMSKLRGKSKPLTDGQNTGENSESSEKKFKGESQNLLKKTAYAKIVSMASKDLDIA